MIILGVSTPFRSGTCVEEARATHKNGSTLFFHDDAHVGLALPTAQASTANADEHVVPSPDLESTPCIIFRFLKLPVLAALSSLLLRVRVLLPPPPPPPSTMVPVLVLGMGCCSGPVEFTLLPICAKADAPSC